MLFQRHRASSSSSSSSSSASDVQPEDEHSANTTFNIAAHAHDAASDDDVTMTTSQDEPQVTGQSSENETETSSSGANKAVTLKSHDSQKSMADFETLSKEFEDLQNKMACKICLDAKIEVLFLPCRHLVCCSDCATRMRECPFCRKKIDGTVKVFM